MTSLDIFENRKVLIIGDVMLDRYWWGTVNRISPEAPVPVIRLERTTAAPGGAANVAANVKSLGADPILVGVIGRDEEGLRLSESLTSLGVSAEYLTVANGRPTSVKTRIIAHSQQVARVDRETTDTLADEDAEKLLEKYESAMDSADVVLVSDYAKGTLCAAVLANVIALAKTRRVPVLVDPKGKDYQKYKGATILTPNRREAAEACKLDEHLPDVTYLAGNMLLTENGFSNVLITESENGMTLFTRGAEPIHYDALAHEVYDVTGAGDTVIATLAVGIAAGMNFAEAARIANIAAGIAVGQIGAVSVRRDQILAALEKGF
jgi:D-beta-D-heptose 7-phosphate kinase/D-beta-D-heptose 1-phosphate adenosyltransferase